ncbi:MAG: diacylglycerol/lipid kinase family protein [Anaerolineae bacterium]
MEQKRSYLRSKHAKLLFNPGAGAARNPPANLADIVRELQAWNIVPETYLVEPGSDVAGAVNDALARGIRLFVVCGGDGTVSPVAGMLAGTPATLGIIPIGTRNNTALSLGIPEDIPTAIAYLRQGRRIKVDIGMATCGQVTKPFLEVCSVGLVSTLFPYADDIQHGNLARIGDLLAALVSTPPGEIHMTLDSQVERRQMGYVVLASNMPYIGLHYLVGDAKSHNDGLLDVLFFADLSKLDLLSYVFQGVGKGKQEDERIEHFHVRSLDIATQPGMPIMIDGTPLGEGAVHLEVRKRVVGVMVGALPRLEQAAASGSQDGEADEAAGE